MNLPSLEDLDVFGKRVLLRMDTDVPFGSAQGRGPIVADDTRLSASVPTIKYLIEEGCSQITILGHRGRPGGRVEPTLSLEPVADCLEKLLEKEFGKDELADLPVYMAENLRFNPGEVLRYPQDPKARKLAESWVQHGDVYVNDAFGSTHREDVSIVGLPDLLPSAAGFSLISEVEALERVLDDPKRPVVFVLGGGKEDKALLVDHLLEHADWVLLGGVLPRKVKSYCKERGDGMCVSAAHLDREGKDITPQSVQNFVEIVRSAGTIVWGGPMGDMDSGFWESTESIGKAIASSKAYKVAGGGDTIHAIKKLKLEKGFDHMSLGGGAMLELLAYGDLPGLRALRGED